MQAPLAGSCDSALSLLYVPIGGIAVGLPGTPPEVKASPFPGSNIRTKTLDY